ncbi:CDP-alcohol phosphatidyltransferase family protein [Streptomyces sp. URMC 123]|uniref:CDP-alcohol phosphatidyltransferase family protein n=1 Tax=Streptomyces sp. URMC 123 TaxID=3423403 RepID=UPI003F1BB9F1
MTPPHGKTSDSLALRLVYRPLAAPVARALIRLDVRPAAITWAAFAVTVCGALLAAGGWALAGAAVLTTGFVLDACDGAVARATGTVSQRGAMLDTVLDRYADLGVIVALVLAAGVTPAHWAWGAAAASGGLLVSYANALRPNASATLVRRGERALLCTVAMLAARPMWALVILAIACHLDAARAFTVLTRSAPGPVTEKEPS